MLLHRGRRGRRRRPAPPRRRARRDLARVARKALEIFHFDPDTGADLEHAAGARERCERGCYDCLLSYGNQYEHRLIDRHSVVEILRSLLDARVEAGAGGRRRADQARLAHQARRLDPGAPLRRLAPRHRPPPARRRPAHRRGLPRPPRLRLRRHRSRSRSSSTARSTTPTHQQQRDARGRGPPRPTLGWIVDPVPARRRLGRRSPTSYAWRVRPRKEHHLMTHRDRRTPWAAWSAPAAGSGSSCPGRRPTSCSCARSAAAATTSPASSRDEGVERRHLPDAHRRRPRRQRLRRACCAPRCGSGSAASAGPFRSLAGIAVEPRAYQFVPLLHGAAPGHRPPADRRRRRHRQDHRGRPDRRRAARPGRRRSGWPCSAPPPLAEQWQRELRDKFGIDAELVLPPAPSSASSAAC